MLTAELLMELYESSSVERKWELSYVYANEACLLLLEASAGTAPWSGPSAARLSAASRARKRALYQLLPTKRLVDRVEALLKKARKSLREERYEEAVRWATTAYNLQSTKKPTPLLIRSDAYDKLGRYAYSYVDATEGLLLSYGDASHLLGLQRDARYRLPGYDPQKQELVEVGRSRDAATMFAESSRIRSAVAYHPSLWPRRVELEALNITWIHTEPMPKCDLEKVDGSFVSPRVYFQDLPTFFANHTDAGTLLSAVRFSFYADSNARGYIAPLTDSHLRTLFEISTCHKASGGQRAVSPFASLQDVRLMYADFHNITAASFNQLFTSVLPSKRYQFLDLKRLPIGISPADFLQHPSLVACRDVLFSFFGLLHYSSHLPIELQRLMRTPQRVVQFPPEDVVAYLKACSRATPAGQLPPYLVIHEAYLAGGVMPMVEEAKRDFLASRLPSPVGCPFDLVISYHDASTFVGGGWRKNQRGVWRDGESGEWRNGSGERLCIYVGSDKDNKLLCIHDNYQVGVYRCGMTPPRKY